FNVFIKVSPEAWYYFGLQDDRLLVHSSNREFNNIISKRGGKAKIGEVAFIPGSDEETVEFINRFRREYYKIDVPYDLNDYVAPTTAPALPPQIDDVPQQRQQTPPPAIQDNTRPADETPDKKRKAPAQKKNRKKADDDSSPVDEPVDQRQQEVRDPEDEGF